MGIVENDEIKEISQETNIPQHTTICHRHYVISILIFLNIKIEVG